MKLELVKSTAFCCKPGSCPVLRLLKDSEGFLWIEIDDDFGGHIKIVGNQQELKNTIDDLFSLE